ncbi:MAG: hypothetical protein MUF80_10480 [Burkholderiales bacterium]|nr:hypothetical protein [Burkholderiales bacterium]
MRRKSSNAIASEATKASTIRAIWNLDPVAREEVDALWGWLALQDPEGERLDDVPPSPFDIVELRANALAAWQEQRARRIPPPQFRECVLEPRHFEMHLLAQHRGVPAIRCNLRDQEGDAVGAHALAADVVHGRGTALQLP